MLMPKIPYVTFDELSERKKAELDGSRELWDSNINVIKMVANSPVVFDSFVEMGAGLLIEAALDSMYREYAILRVAIVNRCRYEWAQHVPIAMAAGISLEKVAAVTDWESSDMFDEKERIILAFTDEVLQHTRPSEKTFDAASAFLSRQSLTELVFSIGYWNMVAYMLNTMDVELEADFKDRYGDILPTPEPEW